MKKRYIIFLTLFVLCFFAVISNPSKEEYVSFVKEEIAGEGHPFMGMFSGPFINAFTKKQNFGLFTLYETQFDETKGDYLKAVGFLNNFYWVHMPENSPKK